MTTDTTARDRIHAKFCRDDQCVLEYADPGKNCLLLDHLLDEVENPHASLQEAYRQMLELHTGTLLKNGPDAAGGLARGIKVAHDLLPEGMAQAVTVSFAEASAGDRG